MKLKRKFGLLFICLFILLGCMSPNKGVQDPNLTEQENVFNEFWTLIDDYYGSIEAKNIDWDRVYTQYRPSIDRNTNDEELLKTLNKIMNLYIKDGHAYLQYKKDEPLSYNPTSLNDDLLDKKFNTLNQWVTFDQEDKHNPYIRYGSCKGHSDIGYLLSLTFEPENESIEEDEFFQESVHRALKYLRNKEALIIDLRFNGGGILDYAYGLGGRFLAREKAPVCRMRVKVLEGDLKGEMGPWISEKNGFFEGYSDDRAEGGVVAQTFSDHYWIHKKGDFQFTKPIILLTSKATASSAEFFTAALREEEHVTQVGETSFGIFSGSEYFTLYNGRGKWHINLPVQDVEIWSKGNYKSFEGLGLEPQYQIPLQEDQINFIINNLIN